MNPILFLSLAKKYEDIATASINTYLNFCMPKMKEAFIVYEDSVDIDKLKINASVRYMSESDAKKILAIDDRSHISITHDKWILQQFFKLNCDILSERDDCIITDVDGLLLKPINHLNVHDNRQHLFCSDIVPSRTKHTRLNLGYFFNRADSEIRNFITENALFRKRYLTELRVLIGDIRKVRRYVHSYDVSQDTYNAMKGKEWPSSPSMTDHASYYASSINTVIFERLPVFAQEEIKKNIKPTVLPLAPGINTFSEYEIYNYFMLLNYPSEIKIKPIVLQCGLIPVSNATYFCNDFTPPSCDVFRLVHDKFYQSFT